MISPLYCNKRLRESAPISVEQASAYMKMIAYSTRALN